MDGPKPFREQRRHIPQPGTEGGAGRTAFLREPVGKRFRSVKGKNLAAPGVRLQKVRESGFDPGALVAEGQGAAVGFQIIGQAFTILRGLNLKFSQSTPFPLGFHDARGGAVHKEEIIRFAVTRLEGEIADGYTAPAVTFA